MPIYELEKDRIIRLEESTFTANQIRERDDLQRLLRENIEVISPGTLIIAEEFGQWEDSRRRIDLLGIDAEDARLVVIELKRTTDGGHMDLQALRYAAMISTMTFSQVVDTFSAFLSSHGRDTESAEDLLLKHLGWEEPDEEAFAQDVRIVLAAADFSKELTTSAMWLNQRNLDITCVRLKPYRLDSRILLDVQPIVPLPEAADFQVRIAQKQISERISHRTSGYGDSKHLAAAIETHLAGEMGCTFTQRQGKIVKFLPAEWDSFLPQIGASWPRIDRRTPFLFTIRINNRRPGISVIAELGGIPNTKVRQNIINQLRDAGCSIDRRGDRPNAAYTRCISKTTRFQAATIDQVSEREALELFRQIWQDFEDDVNRLEPILRQVDWKLAGTH